MPILKINNLSSSEEFVQFWANLYAEAEKEYYYDDNIGKELMPKGVQELYLWKNGGNFSKGKKKTVENNFIAKIEDVNRLDKDILPKDFLNKFSEGGAIWRIFFLHIWQPKRYPIYDQHVHRAMMFLRDGKKEEISTQDPEKIETYLADYLPFYAGFKDDGKRSVDRALWTFGKFLKSPFEKMLDIE